MTCARSFTRTGMFRCGSPGCRTSSQKNGRKPDRNQNVAWNKVNHRESYYRTFKRYQLWKLPGNVPGVLLHLRLVVVSLLRMNCISTANATAP